MPTTRPDQPSPPSNPDPGAEPRGRTPSAEVIDWAGVLDRARRGDERALLRLSRRISELLARAGAWSVADDWSATIHEVAREVLARWSAGEGEAGALVERVSRDRFFGRVLDLLGEPGGRAGAVLVPAIRRLLLRWDGSRSFEASWDDIAQDTVLQLWQAWRGGSVDRPFALLCTIAKRRYLDRVRAARPTDEVREETLGEVDGEGAGGGLFTGQLLEVLEPAEREIIVRMDLEGRTRVEIAGELGMTEGEVLSIRRAGLRRIWRHLGDGLPPEHRAVWLELFKGARRCPPAEVAARLGRPEEEVRARIAEARALLGIGGLG